MCCYFVHLCILTSWILHLIPLCRYGHKWQFSSAYWFPIWFDPYCIFDDGKSLSRTQESCSNHVRSWEANWWGPRQLSCWVGKGMPNEAWIIGEDWINQAECCALLQCVLQYHCMAFTTYWSWLCGCASMIITSNWMCIYLGILLHIWCSIYRKPFCQSSYATLARRTLLYHGLQPIQQGYAWSVSAAHLLVMVLTTVVTRLMSYYHQWANYGS